MSPASYSKEIRNMLSQMTSEQVHDYYMAIADRQTMLFDSPYSRHQVAMEILRHGSYAQYHDYLVKMRERNKASVEKATATRAKRRLERETLLAAELAVPGFVFICRFRFDDEWYYKFLLAPPKSSRLEVFRRIWVDTGAKGFIKYWVDRSHKCSNGKSSKIKYRDLREFYDVPTGKPTGEQLASWMPEEYHAPEVVTYEPVECRPDASGYVYLIKALHDETLFKIGKTRNPEKRKTSLGVKLPFPIDFECLIKTDDMHSLEYRLHDEFVGRRLDGEWFRLSSADVEYIRSLEQA